MSDAYELADWLGYLSRAEVDVLKLLAEMLPDNPTVVNIGAGGGTSALAMLEARADLRLWTVDLQRESSPLGCLEGEMNALRNAGVAYEGRYWQIWNDSKSVDWTEGPVDLVFIDGDHSYEGCRGDIKAWLPRIKRGGLLALHDYHKPPDDKPHPGVDQAVDELLRGRYPCLLEWGTVIAFKVE
jgi:predicted O-methyltransferase YrrM